MNVENEGVLSCLGKWCKSVISTKNGCNTTRIVVITIAVTLILFIILDNICFSGITSTIMLIMLLIVVLIGALSINYCSTEKRRSGLGMEIAGPDATNPGPAFRESVTPFDPAEGEKKEEQSMPEIIANQFKTTNKTVIAPANTLEMPTDYVIIENLDKGKSRYLANRDLTDYISRHTPNPIYGNTMYQTW
jgi:hypothetical protein